MNKNNSHMKKEKHNITKVIHILTPTHISHISTLGSVVLLIVYAAPLPLCYPIIVPTASLSPLYPYVHVGKRSSTQATMISRTPETRPVNR
jgi:hypothetical protein